MLLHVSLALWEALDTMDRCWMQILDDFGRIGRVRGATIHGPAR